MSRLCVLMALFAWQVAAAPITYSGTFAPENNSGVTGTVMITLDANVLVASLNVTGLEPNQIHAIHIHGRLDGSGNALPPLTPQDLDHDGFIETPEGAHFVGDVLLSLDNPPGSGIFSTAPGGVINFTQTYTLSATLLNELTPLEWRSVEVHGLTVGTQGLGTPYEVNGIPGYKAELPVASAVFVPEPGSLALLGIGVIAFFGLTRFRRVR
jgi:PEP-CTERM motif/CHRD domain